MSQSSHGTPSDLISNHSLALFSFSCKLYKFIFIFQELLFKMEKSTGVNILLMVLLSYFIPITVCLQIEGGKVTDGRIKSAGEEDKVRILAV